MAAHTYAAPLARILNELPENDMAILREEGLALLGELEGDTRAAIRHRKREIQLMEKLHKDVEAGDYDQQMKSSILVGRDENALQERQAILRALQERSTGNQHASSRSRKNSIPSLRGGE